MSLSRTQRSEAWTCGPAASSQALYHWATGLSQALRGNKTFMLISTEHEISTAHKTKLLKNKDFSCLQLVLSDVVFIMLINVKMPTIVMSMINFILSWVEHEKSFVTSGPDLRLAKVMILWKNEKPIFTTILDDISAQTPATLPITVYRATEHETLILYSTPMIWQIQVKFL